MNLRASGRAQRRRIKHDRRLYVAAGVGLIVAVVAILVALFLLSQREEPVTAQVGEVSFSLPAGWMNTEEGVFTDRTGLSQMSVRVVPLAPEADVPGMLVSTFPTLADINARTIETALGPGSQINDGQGLTATAVAFEYSGEDRALVVGLSSTEAGGIEALALLLESASLTGE